MFNIKGRYWIHSAFCVFLYASYVLHNVIAWMKIRPFLSRRLSLLFIGTVCLTIPFWILETYGNFIYYNKSIKIPFQYTRCLEFVFRSVLLSSLLKCTPR